LRLVTNRPEDPYISIERRVVLHRTWTVELEDGSHTISLDEDEKPWGERSVVVDGRVRSRTRKGLVDLGRMVQFDLAGHPCSVRFEYHGIVSEFVPEFVVAGRLINTPWDGRSLPLSAAKALEAVDPTLFPRGSTSYKLWRFWRKGVNHRIELFHAWFSGHLHVHADGLAIVKGQRPKERVTTLQMIAGGSLCTIRIQDFGMERLYECTIDREQIFSDANADTLLRGSYNPVVNAQSLLRPAASSPIADKEELLRPEQR
jgi:hypothetical protein